MDTARRPVQPACVQKCIKALAAVAASLLTDSATMLQECQMGCLSVQTADYGLDHWWPLTFCS